MPIIKYIPIYSAPKRLLSYVSNEKKTENVFVTGLNCSANPDEAYEDMKSSFELFSGERFFKKSMAAENDGKQKQKIRMHHYIQSFAPGEVTPEEAHQIGREWAEAVFGKNHQILFATHIDRGHIHNHFAVLPYDMEGHHWNANRKTLSRCKDISDKIAQQHGLSIIEKPKYKANHNYGENRARKGGYSWKQKLCDEIDRIIMKENVKSIDDLVEELKAKGYIINRGKYLSVKVKPNRKPIRSFRLGDGYSLEHLEYRIANKNLEMPLSEALKYQGIRREYALCIRQLQIEIYRKPESERLHFATYREIENSSRLLFYLTENDIHSVRELENKVHSAADNVAYLNDKRKTLIERISEENRMIEDIPKYLELKNKKPMLAKDIKELAKYNYLKNSVTDISEHMKNLEGLKNELSAIEENLKNAETEKKEAEYFYRSYTFNMTNDYEILLERAKAEIENIRKTEKRTEEEKEKNQKIREEQERENRQNERE